MGFNSAFKGLMYTHIWKYGTEFCDRGSQ